MATTSVLGSIVESVVGDAAEVVVVIPNGADPHGFQGSAEDVEANRGADLVVVNGMDLEEGLLEALEEAEAKGVAVFHMSDHVTVRGFGAGGDDAGDPHLWTDPLTVTQAVVPLAEALSKATGVQLEDRVTAFLAELRALDERVRATLRRVPSGQCHLVTGHESLGYFADRFGCVVVGAVIPGLSTDAGTSAASLAELRDAAVEFGVRAVFSEEGTPGDVAGRVADEIGVPVVELPSHGVPDDGGYVALIATLAERIADALSGGAR